MKTLFGYVIMPILVIALICSGVHWVFSVPWSVIGNILAFFTPLSGIICAYLAIEATRKKQARTVEQNEEQFCYPVRKGGELQIASLRLEGKWRATYTWKDSETGEFHPATEEIVIDFFDRETGEIRGTAADQMKVDGTILPSDSGSKGQTSEIRGKVFNDRLVFYYTSKKPDRDSYGCAALEFDNSTPTSLKGLVIFNDVKRGRLFGSRYAFERAD